MQLSAYFDYETSQIVLMIIPGAGSDEWDANPAVKSLSVRIQGAGEILRKPFTMDGEDIDNRRGLIAELEELHSRADAEANYHKADYCEHCNELCHSYEGLSCDDIVDGKWPCATMTIVQKYKAMGEKA